MGLIRLVGVHLSKGKADEWSRAVLSVLGYGPASPCAARSVAGRRSVMQCFGGSGCIGYEHVPKALQPEEEGVEDDPKVEVETSEGLVESVEGEEAGEHTYEHDGEQLVSHEDEEGKTEYEYTEDDAELLIKEVPGLLGAAGMAPLKLRLSR